MSHEAYTTGSGTKEDDKEALCKITIIIISNIEHILIFYSL